MPDKENRLTLVREISRSGIATVWEGYDAGLDRKVLVKSIHPQYARDAELRARFEREARAVARLSHPNVVQIYDLRADADELAIVLEFVEGVTLGRMLKEQERLPADAAVTIADGILAGLEQAHQAAIIHRDLKPENVLIGTRGDVKITDFGLATLRDQPAVTQEGAVVGTPSYMAPEQAEGGDLSPATDIFTTGLILFEMLTGRRVHPGGNLAESFQNVLKYRSPDLEEFGDAIPAGLRPVLQKMLERSPERRFTGAGEARTALRAAHGENLLPQPLIADFLAAERVRQPAAGRRVRGRRWSPRALGYLTLVVLGITGAGLIFHFATLRTVSHKDAEQAATADSTALTADPDSLSGAQAGGGDAPDEPPERRIDSNTTIPGAAVTERIPLIPPPAIESVPGFGRVSVYCTPWASVYVGDSLLGTSPLPEPVVLSAGNHNLVFLNPEIGHPVVRNVHVKPDTMVEIRVNLYDYVGRIRIANVRPWADVFIDGEFALRTPSSKIIFKPLGKHVVTFRNPAHPDHTDTLILNEGDPVKEIRVDLTKLYE